MGHSSSRTTVPGLKVPSIILEESVAHMILRHHLVDGRIPTPIEEGAFLAALEALSAVEPRMRNYNTSFRARSLIKACDDFCDRLHAMYYEGESERDNQETQDNDSSGSSEFIERVGAPEDAQSPVSGEDRDPRSLRTSSLASSSTAVPCLTTDAFKSSSSCTEKSGGKHSEHPECEEQPAPDAAADDEHRVCAKVQALESKVAKLERTVSILTKLVERSNSARRAVRQQKSSKGDDQATDPADAQDDA